MDYKTIELQLRQLEESFSKSRSNIYSDKRKESHFTELYLLFNEIKKSDYENFNYNQINDHSQILNIIFKGLEYLDNSTLNIIPYEIVSCLEYALGDWVDNENFVIVTSLSNRNTDFYLETTVNQENFNILNAYIQKEYKLKITHRLIQICLPKVLVRDYLSCVVLYHELGHFIDNQLNISKKLLLKKYRINAPDSQESLKYYRHKAEYFADLFAAQYINDASNIYLNHIAHGALDSDTHPETQKRINVVTEFLEGKSNVIIHEINEVLDLSNLPKLKIRHKKIKVDECSLQELYPQKFDDISQLHYIFKLGWEIWNNSSTNFLKEFSSRQKYTIINNLIEKSISNYVISNSWNEITKTISP